MKLVTLVVKEKVIPLTTNIAVVEYPMTNQIARDEIDVLSNYSTRKAWLASDDVVAGLN